jgi:enoyl-CoA hydratase/carnithine racemase
MQEHQDWLFTQEGHIATITLNRPEVQNNITNRTLVELREISSQVGEQKDVWVVVLEGRGNHFSVGIDLQVITSQLDESLDAVRDFVRTQQECIDAFATLAKPTIAKLHGFCIGGGLLLALCCDFRIASTRTIFHLPEVRLGLPILWGAQRVSQMVGEAQARELILLCKRIRAKDALAYGLIHEVVSPEALEGTVKSLAERFLRLPPKTVAATKRIMTEAYKSSLQDSQDRELDSLTEIIGDPDVQEAIQSYLEQRSPKFLGE